MTYMYIDSVNHCTAGFVCYHLCCACNDELAVGKMILSTKNPNSSDSCFLCSSKKCVTMVLHTAFNKENQGHNSWQGK